SIKADPPRRRQDPERGMPGGGVLGELARRRLVNADLLDEPAQRLLAAPIRKPCLEFLAQARHGLRQFVGAARRLAEPERDVGRLTLRVLNPQRTALD